MRSNTKGLKKDLYKPLEDKLRRKLQVLPDIAVKFLHSTKKKIRTQIEYAKDLTLFFEFLIESDKIRKDSMALIDHKDIQSLDVDDLEDFLDYLLEYTRTYMSQNGKSIEKTFENSPIGIARKRATLARFYGYLVNRDYLDVDITKKLEKEDIPDKTGIKQRLEPEEIERLFQVILDDEEIGSERLLKFHQKVKFRDYIIVLLLAYTGIRVSELIQLDIEDIYLKRQYFEILRKGGNWEQVKMPKRIIQDISDYIEERKKMEFDTNALFVSLRKKRLSDKTVREMLKKYQVRSGIDIHLTPHVFRRTFGTNHYNTYQDMYLTAKALGHSSAETTRKHYADPSQQRYEESMDEFSYDTGKDESSDITASGLKRLADKFGLSVEELRKEMNG